jgi:hypothetical protein
MRIGLRILPLACTLVVAACSGNGTGTGPAPNLPSIQNAQNAGAPASAQSTIHVGAAPTTAAIPPAGGFTGTLAFAAASTPADLAATATTTAPSGNARKALSAAATVFYSITLTAPTTVSFSSIPAITLTFPAAPPAGESLYVSLSSASTGATLGTDGPATVSGRTVTFPAVTTPFTITAGSTYVLTVYGVPTASQSLIYVANPNNYSVSVFPADASGDVAPIRKIAGDATHIASPIAMAVDQQGVLWLLEGYSPLTVLAFAPDANGNVAPLHEYTLANDEVNVLVGATGPGAAITITPDGTGFVVAAVTNTPGIGPQDIIATYAKATGAVERRFVPANLNYCVLNCSPPTEKGTFRGVGFTKAGAIITGYYLVDRSNFGDGTVTFDAAANTSDLTVTTPPLATGYATPQITPGETGAFIYGYSAGEYGWARGHTYVPGGIVQVYQDNGNSGTLKATLNGSATLLDENLDGIAIGKDGTVYVVSSTGFVNAYAPGANGNVAPVRRISGQSTGLVNTSAFAVFSP